MKKISIITMVLCVSLLSVNAQKVEFNQDFEASEKGKDVTKLQKNKFTTWGKAIFIVSEEKGKGNNKSNKFASSDDTGGATLVVYRDLEVGATYEFSVAVKITNIKSKGAYVINASSGKKEDIHRYGQDKMENPKANKWKEHKLEFTVVEGREKVALNVYRWAKDVTLNVDDFKLVKK